MKRHKYPKCPKCGKEWVAKSYGLVQQCQCYTYTVPIRSDGTALMPNGKVVRVREEMRK